VICIDLLFPQAVVRYVCNISYTGRKVNHGNCRLEIYIYDMMGFAEGTQKRKHLFLDSQIVIFSWENLENCFQPICFAGSTVWICHITGDVTQRIDDILEYKFMLTVESIFIWAIFFLYI